MSLSVLHVIRSINPALGGPGEVVRQLSRAHREMGLNVEVATLDAPKSPAARSFPGGVQALGERDSTTGYGFSKKFVPWLRENRGRFDAVISHGLWQYNSFGTWQALRGTKTPYYVFPHGMLDPWFKRAYPAKHFKKRIYWMLRERHVLRDAKAVLFTCEEERRLAAGTFKPYACTEQVIPLGIAPSPRPGGAPLQRTLFFEKFPHYLDKRLLLFLGRLHDKKGCEMLIEAFAKIAPRIDAAYHLAMAGPCEDRAYLQKLIAMAEARCPAGSVSFPGMLAGEMKWGALYGAEAFILPSHQENFGIAVVEALACGVPVLISDKVNIWSEIKDSGAGLVETDDVAGTLALLERWTQMDDAGREAMREAALACFTEKFRIERTARELLAMISASARNAAASPDPAASPA
jgi:glycosyltransferase involved in cell wall biosynthesis